MAFTTSMQGSFLSAEDTIQLFANETVSYYWIKQHDNYPQIISAYNQVNESRLIPTQIPVPQPLREKKFVDFSVKEDWFFIAEAIGQIAATCHLVQGCHFNNDADKFAFRELARQVVQSHIQQHGEAGLNQLAYMFEIAEGVRAESILRSLGLFSLPHNAINLLSLGSGSGYKELHGVYSDAVIEPASGSPSNTSRFRVTQQRASHTILVDPEPGYREYYEALTRDNNQVLALNTYTKDALPDIAKRIESTELMKRNVVTAFRMDPVMLPDVDAFFRQLKSVIKDTTHLIVSVGSGNDVEGFAARLHKMREIKAWLHNHGMQAYDLKLFRGSDIAEGFEKPVYGYGAFATYEILYCELSRENIS